MTVVQGCSSICKWYVHVQNGSERKDHRDKQGFILSHSKSSLVEFLTIPGQSHSFSCVFGRNREVAEGEIQSPDRQQRAFSPAFRFLSLLSASDTNTSTSQSSEDREGGNKDFV